MKYNKLEVPAYLKNVEEESLIRLAMEGKIDNNKVLFIPCLPLLYKDKLNYADIMVYQ